MSLIQRASTWAQLHPKKSRLIIAIATFLSIFLHYYYGVYLFAYDLIIPYNFAIGAIVLGVTGALLYPNKHHQDGLFAYSYRKQKSLDFLIFVIGGLLVMYLGNQRAAKVFAEPMEYVGVTEEIDSQKIFTSSLYLPVSEGAKGQGPKKPDFVLSRAEMRRQIRQTLKEVKKALRAEIRTLRKQRKKGKEGDGLKTLLTLLTVLGAIALGMLVAGLACSLSCNGNELAGTVVLIVGWAGIIILSFFVIKKILDKESRPKPEPKNKDSSYPY